MLFLFFNLRRKILDCWMLTEKTVTEKAILYFQSVLWSPYLEFCRQKGNIPISFLFITTFLILLPISRIFKDGAYYCYCAYFLRISRYSDFLLPMLTNTGIFLRSLKPSGESRS